MGNGARKETDLISSLNSWEGLFANKVNISLDHPPIIRLEGSHKITIENQSKDPKLNWTYTCNIDTTLLKGPKGPLGLIISLDDLKTIQEFHGKLMQIESLISERELAASYVHEIKNPLFSIRGFLQLLEKNFSEKDKHYKYINIIIEELDRIQHMIDDFLSMIRISRTTEENYDYDNPIQKTIQDTINLFKFTFQAKDIECNFDGSKDPLFVSIHKGYLMQIFTNLFQNSIEAMESGKALYIKMKHDEDTVFIEFKDEGVGIKGEDLQNIFNPFFSTKEQGTGLGLYITKNIIESCGGKISAESIYGKGTIFHVELPRKK